MITIEGTWIFNVFSMNRFDLIVCDVFGGEGEGGVSLKVELKEFQY